MRALVCLLALSLACSMAAAQSVERKPAPTTKSAADIKAIEERVAYWRTTCLQDWDAATHMSKSEWRLTCERVATERRAFLLRDPDSFSMDGKGRQR
jgi:hypothetical protein